MKTCSTAIFFYSAIIASLLNAAPQDTTVFNVKVYACKPDSGDCRRIIWKNRLSDIPCDSGSARETYRDFTLLPVNGYSNG